MALEIGEIVVEDGDTRFVDHSTTPFFSEEISRLALTLRGFRNTPDARADVAVHAVVAPRGALELSGQVAPLGQPFYLDLAGELRDIAMAQANPYMRFYSGWIARTGSVTTKVHYRIVGDELEASNDVHVQKIRVERAPGADAGVSKRVGLPLGLIVAMITDARGDIEFKVPVAGKLGTPGWSFGDAIWSAIKNVLVNVAAAPFRAIGKLFGGGGGDAEAEQFQVDPVRFAAGSADVSPDAQQQLQRVADFMRASPYVKIAIEPVVSAEDVLSLKTQEVVARVQQAQRERALADFAAAVAAVWSDAALPPPPPKTTDEMIALLRDREPSPDAAIRRLAARRAEVARTTLIETAGIEPARLQERDGAGSVGDAAAGCVQFELVAE
jgi:outer membrane protein OmpA-like peptidoglycan-associated protein